MTTKELIEELQKLDPEGNLEVNILLYGECYGDECDVNTIEQYDGDESSYIVIHTN